MKDREEATFELAEARRLLQDVPGGDTMDSIDERVSSLMQELAAEREEIEASRAEIESARVDAQIVHSDAERAINAQESLLFNKTAEFETRYSRLLQEKQDAENQSLSFEAKYNELMA